MQDFCKASGRLLDSRIVDLVRKVVEILRHVVASIRMIGPFDPWQDRRHVQQQALQTENRVQLVQRIEMAGHAHVYYRHDVCHNWVGPEVVLFGHGYRLGAQNGGIASQALGLRDPGVCFGQ
ncbi:hypothetical protein D3C71_1646430 [compost metagenome]